MRLLRVHGHRSEYVVKTVKGLDPITWGALGCALVGTAHAEYTLGTAAGAHWAVAAAVPGALDLYVLKALRVHRDVLPAVLVMVAANVASYLIQAGVLPVGWPVYSAVGALAPLILWRVHHLRGCASTDRGRSPEPGVPGEYAPGTDPGTVRVPEVHVLQDAPAVPESRVRAPEAVPAPVLAAVPDVPGDEYKEGPSVLACEDWVPEYLVAQVHPDPDPSTPYLEPGDAEYVPAAAALPANRRTIRGLKDELSIGQKRAERILRYLRSTS